MTGTGVNRRHTLCWGTLRHLSLAELIAVADRNGYAAVTASVVEHGAEIRKSASRLVDLCRLTGVRVECVEPIISPLPGLRDSGDVSEQLCVYLDIDVNTVCECAVAVGARSVNVAHFLGRPHDINELTSSFGDIAEIASDHGLVTTVEFIPGTGIATLDNALHIVSHCGQPNARLLIDAWHLAATGASPDDLDRVPAGLIDAVQLCDKNDSSNEQKSVFSHRQLPGSGTLPVAELIAAARRNNAHVDLQVEVFNEELPKRLSPDQIAASAHAALNHLS